MLASYPWQQQQWQHLQSRWQRQLLPHAILLTGILGLGQYEFARAFAGLLLCERPIEHDKACGQCGSCQLFQANSHPDYFEITSLEKSKTIKVDQIRELIDHLNKTATYEGYQVAVLHPAEAMNSAAANALLKILEEPPGKVVIFLVSYQPYTLPATILSRCQKLIFQTQPRATIRAWLTEQLGTNTAIDLWLKLAEYAPLRAVEFAKNNFLLVRDRLLKQLLQINQQHMVPITGVEDLLQFDLHELLYAFLISVFDISRLQFGIENIINEDCLLQLRQLAEQTDRIKIHYFLSQLQSVRQQLSIVTSINQQLLLEDLLLKWGELKKHVS